VYATSDIFLSKVPSEGKLSDVQYT